MLSLESNIYEALLSRGMMELGAVAGRFLDAAMMATAKREQGARAQECKASLRAWAFVFARRAFVCMLLSLLLVSRTI